MRWPHFLSRDPRAWLLAFTASDPANYLCNTFRVLGR